MAGIRRDVAVRALDVDQPIATGRYIVTFWHAVSDDGDQYASTAEIAESSPACTSSSSRSTCTCRAWHRSRTPRADRRQHLADPGGPLLPHRDAGHAAGRLREPQVRPAAGVIHGDASVGNVLRDTHGTPVLIDLDGFAIGPREWDLALTAIYYDSFGWHTREEYEDFARVYGFDIMQWPGYPVMRSVREFLMVTWVIQKAAESDQAAAEARKRISALRTGASRRDWQPY